MTMADKHHLLWKAVNGGLIFFALSSILLQASGTAPAQHVKTDTGDASFRKTTHTYKTVGKTKIQADVYRAGTTQKKPGVVWIHGGALILGSRSGVHKELLHTCRADDLVLVSIDYRLAPEVKLPAIIEDLDDFWKWVREEGPKLFAIDPNKLVVAGGSAGGYLTMMAGIRCQPPPQALVAYWGYGDVDGPCYVQPSEFYRKQVPLIAREEAYKAVGREVLSGTGPENQKGRGLFYQYLRQNGLWTKEVTGFDPATERAKLDPYCPVRNITSAYPPILMIHGTKDEDVPYEESAAMARELARHKVPHELITIAGAGHGLAGGDKTQVADAHARATAFIRKYLK